MKPEDQARLDDATSQRLSRLAGMPVDTSRLEQRLNEVLKHTDSPRTRRLPWISWRSIASVAAVVAIGVLIGVMSLSGPSVMASTMDLSQVHEEVIAGTLPAVAVTDIPSARAKLQALIDGEPRPKGDYPKRVRCCCGQELAGEQISFLRIQHGRTPVTIVMMQGYHACAGPDHFVTDDQGRRFIVHQENEGVQATLTARPDHWICVMGALSTEELVDITGELVF